MMDTPTLPARCICSFPERKELTRFDKRKIVMCETCGKVVQFECSYCGQNHVEPRFCEQYPDQTNS